MTSNPLTSNPLTNNPLTNNPRNPLTELPRTDTPPTAVGRDRPASAPPRETGSTPRRRRATGTLVAASAAVMVAQIANALPGALNGVFQETFSTVGSQLTWITAAFMIPVVVFELTFGVLGDRFGHRRMVVGGTVLVAAGSLVAMFASTIQMMWVASAINGLGAGAIFPASLALVASVATTVPERVRGIAVWAGFLSAGSAVSPLLGGVLADLGWWQGSYLVVVVVSILAAGLTVVLAADSPRHPDRRGDMWGQITFAVGLIAVLYGLVQGPEVGWEARPVVTTLAVGSVLLVAFVVIESRVRNPLLDLTLFRNRHFSVSSLVAVVGMFAFLGACYSTSMWLGPVQHQSPLYTGLMFLLLQGPAFVLIPVISRLQMRIPSHLLLTVGFVSMAAGAFLASTNDVMSQSVSQFVLPCLLVGIGFAFTLSPMSAVAVNSVPREQTGTASAVTNLLRDLGFALGPVLVGAIALSTAGTQLMNGLQSSGLAPADMGPAMGIAQAGGPIALNSIPAGAPGSVAHPIALESLGSGFAHAYVVVGVAAVAAAILSFAGLRPGAIREEIVEPNTGGFPATGVPAA
ncbi:MFS transporter [Gordonia sp. VNK1]|uniref:MFS transporter n=1 Tax=Gordonia oleivorans TaxID=3156618 RepID=UPI0032B3EE80